MRIRSEGPLPVACGVAGACAGRAGRLAATRFLFVAGAAAGGAGGCDGLGLAARVDFLGDAAGDSAGAGFDLDAFGVARGCRFFSVITCELVCLERLTVPVPPRAPA
jgi:hypothetical protein